MSLKAKDPRFQPALDKLLSMNFRPHTIEPASSGTVVAVFQEHRVERHGPVLVVVDVEVGAVTTRDGEDSLSTAFGPEEAMEVIGSHLNAAANMVRHKRSSLAAAAQAEREPVVGPPPRRKAGVVTRVYPTQHSIRVCQPGYPYQTN